ncbi:signal peptidase I [Bifidobacterium sp.]|jgi:signal peptidase I|uniref:signal peptidase I n=1 Tax=Bifidobacterium sp. TaxID=41200 RepID=UPI0025B87197|nr:signal peptidase I [Bifidobacterium sp.]MCH4159788.1 signal peptidase I [Bifidobacterium sp.]MCH4174980.1 signal peptidase I [Bifidobacterium sp.]MCI1636313.1 signal peptidase I [Bifidobacterium sp.]
MRSDGMNEHYEDSSSADNNQDARILSVADYGVNPDPQQESKPRRSRNRQKRPDSLLSWSEVLIWCGIPILVVIVIRTFLFGFYAIPSGSMLDTIHIGDRVITSQLVPTVAKLQRGDVIVFKDPAHWLNAGNSTAFGQSEYLIKRLIGMPGDTVECDGPGSPITINGVAVDEQSYIRPGVDPSAIAFKVTVSADHVFVLGDNRANSEDSRYHQDDGDDGLVPISDVVGVGLAIYWPIQHISTLNAHHQVFSSVPDESASAQ